MPEAQFTVEPALTAIVRDYTNPAWTLIHERVLPEVPVMGETFKYLFYPIGQGMTVPDTRIAPRGTPNRVELEGKEETGKTYPFGIDIPLDHDTVKEAERHGFQPRTKAAQRSEGLVQLDREKRVAAFVEDPANYNAANVETLAGTDQFSDFANSDPIGVLADMIDRPLIRPNRIVLGQTVWTKTRQHPHLVSARNANEGTRGMITPEDLAELLEVREVIVGQSRINTSRPGKQVAFERVWGNFIAGHFIDPSADAENGVTWGFSARWQEKVAGSTPANIGLRGGELIRSGENIGETLISPDSGFLINTPIAG